MPFGDEHFTECPETPALEAEYLFFATGAQTIGVRERILIRTHIRGVVSGDAKMGVLFGATFSLLCFGQGT